ncbi:MAG: hypothetical protein JSS52_00760 [Proteobacteria bacterium]|nr:hypothetical protein [Pseudomonadota bacterium]
MSNRQVVMARKAVIRNGWRLAGGVDADAVAAELHALHSKHGHLVPELVLDAAAHEGSAMHAAFTWDDTDAAQLWRMDQARCLIKAVKVEYAPGEHVSLYVHVGESGYQPTERVVRSPALYEEAMREARAKVESAQTTVRELERAADDAGAVEVARKARRALQHLGSAGEELRPV